MNDKKRVFVSGWFDMLHSEHIQFLQEAAVYGDVYVGIGSDKTFKELKGREPVYSQAERKYMLEALKYVKACFVNRGSGIIDFLESINEVSPDMFVVNEEGDVPARRHLCQQRGIKYVVLKRETHTGLPARSTTSLRKECYIPYRLDLAGGWMDQPFVSQYAPGPVLTICIEPTMDFNERSGMASSSRRRAIELWQTDIPSGSREKLARVLFCYENPPGTKKFSGSQDAIGIVYPGLNRLDYDGEYWPKKITSVHDAETLRWLEEHLALVALGPRKAGYDVLGYTRITRSRVRVLAAAADHCWKAIQNRNIEEFGHYFRASFEAQVSMFPTMANREVRSVIKQYEGKSLGWKLSGAGGGGYLILVNKHAIPASIKIKIRRK